MRNRGIALHIKLLGGLLACSVMLVGCILSPYASDKDISNTASSPVIAKNADNHQVDSGNSDKTHPPSIYMIEKNIFRFQLGQANVWDSAVSVLIRNYNLNIADKNSGIITTEWDTYYLENKLYRNKVSLVMRRIGWNTTDLIMYNNTQVLQENQQSAMATVWLPAKGDQKEIGRLIQNMASHLNQPMPPLSDEMITMPTSGGREFKKTL